MQLRRRLMLSDVAVAVVAVFFLYLSWDDLGSGHPVIAIIGVIVAVTIVMWLLWSLFGKTSDE
jgi:hypothetical protein